LRVIDFKEVKEALAYLQFAQAGTANLETYWFSFIFSQHLGEPMATGLLLP